MDNQEKEIKDFTINYTDGSSKTVEKGFFCNIKDEPDGGSTLGFDMVGCSGKDISTIVLGCINLGTKLGLFDKKESEEISE